MSTTVLRDQLWKSLAGDHRLVVSLDDVVRGGCVRCSGTNSRPSAWLWQQRCTTRVARCTLIAALHGARRQTPGQERRGTRRITTRQGDRSPLLPSVPTALTPRREQTASRSSRSSSRRSAIPSASWCTRSASSGRDR